MKRNKLQTQVVTGNKSAAELREEVIKSIIEKYEPHKVFKDPVGEDYAIVYVDPFSQTRSLIARRNQRPNAIKLSEMLDRAWAEGRYSRQE